MNDMLKKIFIRLSYFKRYRDTPSSQQESIAEHQYFVTLITKILCDKYKLTQEQKLKALEIALIHDLPEVISDDFSYAMKYEKGSEKFREALEIVEESILKEISEQLNYDNLEKHYDEYKQRISIESKIVKLSDSYSVLLFCEAELLRGENKPVRNILENCERRTEKLKTEIEGEIYARK